MQRLQRPGEAIDERDLGVVEDLLQRHPDDEGLGRIQAAVWLRLGAREQAARRYDAAEQCFRKAAARPQASSAAQRALLGLFQQTGAWAQAEAAARELLASEPGSLEGQRGLAYALFRQDRNREAAEVLDGLLASREDPEARELLQRIRKTGGDEQGMTERRLSRFHVRYDGDTHDEVGREILRALERHYATLTLAFDHSIDSPIPVILFSRESGGTHLPRSAARVEPIVRSATRRGSAWPHTGGQDRGPRDRYRSSSLPSSASNAKAHSRKPGPRNPGTGVQHAPRHASRSRRPRFRTVYSSRGPRDDA